MTEGSYEVSPEDLRARIKDPLTTFPNSKKVYMEAVSSTQLDDSVMEEQYELFGMGPDLTSFYKRMCLDEGADPGNDYVGKSWGSLIRHRQEALGEVRTALLGLADLSQEIEKEAADLQSPAGFTDSGVPGEPSTLESFFESYKDENERYAEADEALELTEQEINNFNDTLRRLS